MKTRISKLVAVAIFSFIFLAGNVSAEGTELKASSIENIEETTLELENWMVNENLWNTSEMSFYINELEENLNLEEWMTNDFTWNSSSLYYSETEQENNLTIEPWMTGIWNKSEFTKAETETKLETEAWMTNDIYWVK